MYVWGGGRRKPVPGKVDIRTNRQTNMHTNKQTTTILTYFFDLLNFFSDPLFSFNSLLRNISIIFIVYDVYIN